ncbi:exopolyphosphatase [Desulfobacterales bacterium HSG2]|nr:exopolyphosphatase [Desulfobacterales bacterium HSG2]
MRLITRADFDGLACAVLLVEAGIVDEYKFVHPKDVQDGKIKVTENDVIANIPYVPGCGLWFDHHSSEKKRMKLENQFSFKGKSSLLPSCARVIYDYYGGAEKFSKFDESGLMPAVDKFDSAQLDAGEIEYPTDWIALSFMMDPRTGLGRYKGYRLSEREFVENMIQYCRSMTIHEILAIPDVQERMTRYFKQEKHYEQMVRENSTIDGNVIIIDLHDVENILPGNRFKEYIIFPEQNISVRIMWGLNKQNMVFTCGHSVINRTSNTDVGLLMLKYGGGGHRAVGSCQIPIGEWERVGDEIIEQMKADG